MSENNQGEKGLFELLEERSPEYMAQSNSKNFNHENLTCVEDEHMNTELLVQDMFLDHFFP